MFGRLEDLSVRAALRLPDLEILGIEGLKKVSSNSFNVLEESKYVIFIITTITK